MKYSLPFIILCLVLTLVFDGFTSITIGASISIMQRKAADSKQKFKTNIHLLYRALNIVNENYEHDLDSKKLVYDAIKGLMKELDPFTHFVEPKKTKELGIKLKGEYGGLGISVNIRNKRLIVISPLEDTPAWEKGLEPMDKIMEINGVSTDGITLEESTKQMRGKPGTDCELTISRNGIDKPFKVVITRANIKLRTVKWRIFDDDYALLRISSFNGDTSRETTEAVKSIIKAKPRGLIIDLRSNPGGILSAAVQISGLFLPEQSLVVYTKGRIPSANVKYRTRIKPLLPKLPIAILINGASASASEIIAGALRDHKRAVLIGTTSFGKGSVQHIFPLFDKSSIVMTVAKYFTPSNECIHEKGITPDVIIHAPSKKELERIKNRKTFWERKKEKKDTKRGSQDKKVEKSTSRKKKKLNIDYQIKRAKEILQLLLFSKDKVN